MQMTQHQHDDTRQTALIIDDSVDVHRLLVAKLRSEELDFVGVTDGEEGVEKAASLQPAIIILDLDMPRMDGLEVLRRLKGDSRTQHVPVIVLSGRQASEEKVQAFELGASDYVTKPFEIAEVRLRLRSVLKTYQLMQMLAQRAQLDGLTGLWNRAHFDERWSEEHARASRHGTPLSLAMVDIDHFKQINDAFGHPAGDAVLQQLARIMRRECRQSDLACRYGGEEFALVMPETPPADAAAVCERLRNAVQQANWPGQPLLRVTVSIGVAGSTAGAPITPEKWIAQADANLYTAKRSGRNRVIPSDVVLPAPQQSLRVAS